MSSLDTYENKDVNSIPDLSILVPAYNEENNLLLVVNSLSRSLASFPISYELIIIDDGSQDRPWELI